MLVEVKDLKKYFSVQRSMFSPKTTVKAVDGVSFGISKFDTVGLVGESGCGKTTLSKMLIKLIQPDSGKINYADEIKDFRQDVQIVFQNPYNSLNPKMRIIDILSEPLIIHKISHGKAVKERVAELLKMVGLEDSILKRKPAEFSGGQRQRICVARALATGPKFLILDEPISSLDLTIQADILDLLLELKTKLSLTYLFVSHNLAVIKHISNRVIVMYQGKIVEEADKDQIFNNPRHPYTRILLDAVRKT